MQRDAQPRANYAATGEAHRAHNNAAQRIIQRAPQTWVARLDQTRARWQGKDALIYPIIYEPLHAPPEPARANAVSQIVFIAPPDLVELPTTRATEAPLPETASLPVEVKSPTALPVEAGSSTAAAAPSVKTILPTAITLAAQMTPQAESAKATWAVKRAAPASAPAPSVLPDSSKMLFASYNPPHPRLSTAVPLLLIAVLLLFVATYLFTIR